MDGSIQRFRDEVDDPFAATLLPAYEASLFELLQMTGNGWHCDLCDTGQFSHARLALEQTFQQPSPCSTGKRGEEFVEFFSRFWSASSGRISSLSRGVTANRARTYLSECYHGKRPGRCQQICIRRFE